MRHDVELAINAALSLDHSLSFLSTYLPTYLRLRMFLALLATGTSADDGSQVPTNCLLQFPYRRQVNVGRRVEPELGDEHGLIQ